MSSSLSRPAAAEAGAARTRLTEFARHAALHGLGASLLCAPALYNRYPLIFPDLLDYGGDGMRIVRATWPSGNHPPFYGVVIEPLHLEWNLWPVVLAHGFIVSHLLHVVLRTIGVRLSSLAFLGLIAGLTALTSLPWNVSVVMPDVFGSILVLSLFMLLFRWHCLGNVERLYFSALSVASLLSHLSFFPVAASLLAIAAVLALFRRRPRRPNLVVGALVLAAAIAGSSLISLKFWGNLKGPPYPPPYLLAHILVDGPGKQFLARECGVQNFVLCDYQSEIPDDVEEFMFRSYSPFFASRQTRQIRQESAAIIVGTFKMFPVQTAWVALRDGLTQIVTFYTEVAQLDELPNSRGGSYATEFAVRLPFVAKGYEGTAQEAGLLSGDRLWLMNAVDALVVAGSTVLALVQLVSAARRRDWAQFDLLLTIMASIVIGGLIAGAAVGVFGRFGARLIWLLPFGAAAVLLARYERDEPI